MALFRPCVVLVSLALGFAGANAGAIGVASAATYEGYVEKTVMLDEPAVVASNVDGHIGILVSTRGYIRHVHPGSPADKVGIRRDDRVVLVDGLKNSVRNISGKPGTEVKLEVERPFLPEHLSFSVERIGIDHIQP